MAAQNAARAAAAAAGSSVPNGLAVNGLNPDSGLTPPTSTSGGTSNFAVPSSWQGINALSQTTVGGSTTVNIGQNTQRAIANWSTFNVGINTIVNFNQQGNTNWVVLNKVNDPSGVPSQILGQIRATGQVYLINRNGIIFGGASQINVGTLVASALPIDDSLVQAGTMFTGVDSQFLFSSYGQAGGNAGPTPASTTDAATDVTQNSKVLVRPGAIINATEASTTGGRVILIGPQVENDGTISTPDGQAILAAGQQVALLPHNSSETSLRGLDVFIGSVFAPVIDVQNPVVGAGSSVSTLMTGQVINAGIIEADRGNISVAGSAITQTGALISTTSASLNGRIDLTAIYNVGTTTNNQLVAPPFPTAGNSGPVTLAPGSVVQILPESSSSDTIVGPLVQSSQINIKGSTIYMAPGAQIEAPGAAQIPPGANAPSGAVAEGGVTINALNQIYIDNGATIDVSGSEDIQVPVSANVLAVQLFGAQLADSPLQRNGVLHGKTVFVDIRQTGTNPDGSTWIGTPLADATGFAGLIPHTIGELTTNGGTINLNATGSIVLQQGSTLNVSGGWIDFQGGFVSTSRLVGADGHLYSMSRATPDRVYVGILSGFTVDHSRWNITETFAGLGGGYYDPGYIQGGSGGSVTINAPTSAIDGDLVGLTVAGQRQRQPLPSPTILSSSGTDITALVQPDYLPTPSALRLASASQDITIEAGVSQQAASFGSNLDPAAPIYLTPTITTVGGFGSLAISTNTGTIRVLSDLIVQPNPSGSINLAATNIDVEANVIAPGGTISITTGVAQTGTAVTLGSGASLSTAGVIADDSIGSSAAGVTPLVINGGSVTISAFALSFAPGSVIDVSAGMAIASNGKQTFGKAGGIQLKEQVFDNTGNGQVSFGSFTLGATLKGYGAGTTGKAGSLSITASSIQIGGFSLDPNAPAGSLLLSSDFFDQGGFANFKLTGTAGVTIAANTAIQPTIESYLPSRGRTGTLLTPGLLPAVLRDPASLSFLGTDVTDPNFGLRLSAPVVMAQGSSIRVDPTSLGTGSVSIGGTTAAILGSIIVPAGSITVTSNAVQIGITSTLGASAVLSTAGTVLPTFDSRGNPLGQVLGGGSISVSGSFVADPNALLDVSGTSGVVNIPSTGHGFTAMEVDSDGGSITLTNTLFFPATLRGDRGGPAALGGSLTVTAHQGGTDSSEIATLQVVQSWASANAGGANFFAVDSFTNGHFASLTLGNQVNFAGPIAISAARSIIVASGGVLSADSPVTLSAPYVAIGQPYGGPSLPASGGGLQILSAAARSSLGSGALSIIATDLIDIGFIGLENIHSTSFTAVGGDIRGYGTLEASGAITMTAAQVYPTTDTAFTIAAFDTGVKVQSSTLGSAIVTLASATLPYGFGVGTQLLGSIVQSISGTSVTLASDTNATISSSAPRTVVYATGSVTFNRAGTNPLPLSAGGQLGVYATTIVQDGVLRAPLGVINLGSTTPVLAQAQPNSIGSLHAFNLTNALTLGSGSITSVSVIDPLTGQALILPYGTMLNGTNWIDPSGTDITLGGVPAKAINLAGASVNLASGSTLDVRGGGDLYAYNFVKGLGGTNDILASSNSFAIVPGYAANYAPLLSVTKKNPDGTTSQESGWSNANLTVGDQITVAASTNGLPAGIYTLLPARYALLPGAFLITPMKGTAVSASVAKPDGSSIVSGYGFDTAHSSLSQQPSLFEVDSSAVVRARAEYDNFFANTTLAQAAVANNIAVPRLPADGGAVNVTATANMIIKGAVQAAAGPGGLGGLANISTPDNIVINDTGSVSNPAANTLYLSATDLTNFGADSLMIGGTRTTTTTGTTAMVTTASIEVANDSTHPLTGPDIILISNGTLTLDAGSDVEQRGALTSPAQSLQIGIVSTVLGQTVSGNGALLRVSSDTSAQIVRADVAPGGNVSLAIGAGAAISGNNVILDSTGSTTFDKTAHLSGKSVALGSGQISLLLDKPGTVQATTGLVLPSDVLNTLQATIRALSLVSYSSIDIYGAGTIGGSGLGSLAFHAATLRGFNAGPTGTVTFNAQSVSIDNVFNESAVAAVAGVDDTPSGTLVFNANTVAIGANNFNVVGYANLDLNAPNGVIGQGAGGLSTAGNLTVTTGLITGAAGANQTISAVGALTVNAPSGNPLLSVGGLGATLNLVGASVTENSLIVLPSGTLTLHATSGDVTVGGLLGVVGVGEGFFDQVKYTDGGQIFLTSDGGNVNLLPGSIVTVAAQFGGGNAGSLSISAANGTFTHQGLLVGGAGAGAGGTFTLDVGNLDFDSVSNSSKLGALNAVLDEAGFMSSRNFRIRTGDVTVDGLATASSFTVSADSGAITVTGTVDASGVTGGQIALYAYNGVTLASGSMLDVHAQQFDAAGKGGSVDIETGEARSINGVMTDGVGWIDIQTGSVIDLSVAGGMGGTLHLRAPQITGVTASGAPIPTIVNSVAGGSDVAIKPINGNIVNASSMVVEGFQVFDITNSTDSAGDQGAITTTVENNVNANGQNFAANTAAIASRLLANNGALAPAFNLRPGEELVTQVLPTISFATGSTLSIYANNTVTFSSAGTVSFTVGGTITHANGTTTSFSAGQVESVATGDLVSLLAPGSMTANSAVNIVGTGNMTLPVKSDWNFNTYRYGPGADTSGLTGAGEPGILTLRAAGNLVLLSSITDGFTPIQEINQIPVEQYVQNLGLSYDPTTQRWNDILLPAGAQSWSYRMTAGADLSAVDFHQVVPLSKLPVGGGSIELGVAADISFGTSSIFPFSDPDRTGTNGNYDLMQKYYQVIRTGTGDIELAAGRDVQLLNPLASIYTAGTQVNTPAANSTLNPGGTVNLAASIPIVFPNTPGVEASNAEGGASFIGVDIVTSTTDGTITYRPSIIANPSDLNNCFCTPAFDVQAVPQRSVFTFSSGINLLNVANVTLNWTATTNTKLTTPGSTVLQLPSSGTVGNIASGAAIFFFSLSGNVKADSDGTITDNMGARPFKAGDLLTSTGPATIIFKSTATITATSSVKVTLPQGSYNTTGDLTLLTVPAGTTLTKGSADGGLFEDYSGFGGLLPYTPIPSVVVTIPLNAGTPTVLLPGMNSITLNGNGTINLSNQSATSLPVEQAFSAFGSAAPAASSYYTASLSPNTTSYAFDAPIVGGGAPSINTTEIPGLFTAPQYSTGGGNVRIAAAEDIAHTAIGGGLYDAASLELPTNWLYRRSSAVAGEFVPAPSGDIASTTWWIDFSNFTQGVGALGGGNVSLKAGRDVVNVDAVVPTNAWMPYSTTKTMVNTQTSQTVPGATNGSVTTTTVSPDGTVTTTVTVAMTINPDGTTTTTTTTVKLDANTADQALFEYGGGNLAVTAGRNISGGIYYVEKGAGTLAAGGSIVSNAKQSVIPLGLSNAAVLPTTLFLGKGSFDVEASGDVALGGVANPFLLPQGILNGAWDRSYFTTYAPTDAVDVSSLAGSMTLGSLMVSGQNAVLPTFTGWFEAVAANGANGLVDPIPTFLLTIDTFGSGQTAFNPPVGSAAMTGLMPSTLRATAFSGNISIAGNLTLMPSPVGTVDLEAAGSVGGFQLFNANLATYQTATINLSDANPASLPTPNSPLPPIVLSGSDATAIFNASLDETGATLGPASRPSVQQALHDPALLHAGDPDPMRIYAVTGDIAGIEAFSPKASNFVAGRDILDVALYLQNLSSSDLSTVQAGRDIVLYDPNTAIRLAVQQAGKQNQNLGNTNFDAFASPVLAGDISIGGPGTLEILAGRNLSTGNAALGTSPTDGTSVGIVSIGNARNPFLVFDHGASIVAGAGLSGPINFAGFISAFLDPATAGDEAARYLPDLGNILDMSGASNQAVWNAFEQLSTDRQNGLALDIFYLVLRDSGRDHNDANAVNGTRNYEIGFQAIATMFPGAKYNGDIALASREIKTAQGGDIDLLAPGGQVLVGVDLGTKQPIDQGILTLESGDINIFANGSVEVGTSKIFTFRGGNEVIWSSTGNIAAGAASKTLVSAPPARFLVDPTTGAGVLDPAGLATGGGIGVLQTVKGAPPGNIDLIAPAGFIDAGDAGIRSSGNISLAAVAILNAGNIQAAGTVTGVPVVAPPPVAALASASNQAGAAQQSTAPPPAQNSDRPSVIIVEFLGFGGGDGTQSDTPKQQQQERRTELRTQDPHSRFQVIGAGALTEEQTDQLTTENRKQTGR